MSDAAARAAVSLMGNASPGRVVRRSRDLTHLLGPGAHRTHLPCAAVYTAIRMFYRVVLANIVPLDVWCRLWTQRHRHKFGPFVLLDRACQALGIEWCTATSFKSTYYTFNFNIRPELLPQAGRGAYPRLRKAACVNARLHDLRVFLRRCLAEREAARRPKDFDGVHRGLSEVHEAREHMFGAQLHYGGPALTSGGLWTSLHKTRIPNHDGDEICVRCKREVETTMHRLWSCPCNAAARSVLDARVPGNQYPDGLPPCLARCGLLPADLGAGGMPTVEEAKCISQYLLHVNAIATLAFAADRKQQPVLLELDRCRSQPVEHIYRAALPPLPRRKPRVPPPAGAAPGGGHRGDQLPQQPGPGEFQAHETLVLSCDGSARVGPDTEASGWGFTVASSSWTSLRDFCGPTVLDPNDPGYIGAARHCNYVGELSALYFALCWVRVYVCRFIAIFTIYLHRV